MNWMKAILLAAAVGAPVWASAQAPERPHAPGEGLRRADTNNDGKVSFEEIKAQRPNVTQEQFGKMDVNGDGFLSAADRGPAAQGKPAKGSKSSDAGQARAQMIEKMMQADANDDGGVSFEEISKAKPGFAKADFDRFDRNKDGVVSKTDLAQTRGPNDRPNAPRKPEGKPAVQNDAARAEFRQRMIAADKNGDGKVTFAEAQKQFPNLTQERFNVMDRNGDGSIGPEDRPQGGPRAGNKPKAPVE